MKNLFGSSRTIFALTSIRSAIKNRSNVTGLCLFWRGRLHTGSSKTPAYPRLFTSRRILSPNAKKQSPHSSSSTLPCSCQRTLMPLNSGISNHNASGNGLEINKVLMLDRLYYCIQFVNKNYSYLITTLKSACPCFNAFGNLRKGAAFFIIFTTLLTSLRSGLLSTMGPFIKNPFLSSVNCN